MGDMVSRQPATNLRVIGFYEAKKKDGYGLPAERYHDIFHIIVFMDMKVTKYLSS